MPNTVFSIVLDPTVSEIFYIKQTMLNRVWIQPTQKVLDSVGKSEYHNITQYTSKFFDV